MPDLKTALSTALEEGKRKFLTATITDWDEHEKEIRTQQTQPHQPHQPQQEKPMFVTTGHLSKDVFDFIKMYDGQKTGPQVEKELEKLGYKASSVGALLTQFKRAGTIKRDVNTGLLSTLVASYIPVSGQYKKKIKDERKAAITAKRLATLAKKKTKAPTEKPTSITVSATNGIAALQPAPTPPTLPTAESVLNNMSILEARKLYDELKKLFS